MKIEHKKLRQGQVDSIAAFVADANKKFAKKGFPTISIEISSVELTQVLTAKAKKQIERDRALRMNHIPSDEDYEWVNLTDLVIEHEPLELGGWEFAAAITDIGASLNLVSAVEGVELPDRFQTSNSNKCEHCNTKRQRKETFVVRNGSEFKQVGRQCIKDFLGHDVSSKINSIAFWFKVLGELGVDEWDGEFDGCGGGPRFIEPNLHRFLFAAVACTDRLGFVSAKARSESIECDGVYNGPDTTREEVDYFLHCRKFSKEDKWWIDLNASDADVAKVDAKVSKVIEWAKSLPLDGGDFDRNLHLACEQVQVNRRTEGLLAAAYHCFEIAEGRKERKEFIKKERAKSSHVGVVGERSEFKLTQIFHTTFASDFGAYHINTLKDENENIFVYKGSYQLAEKGEEITVKATIKGHGEYKETKQTVISRPKVIEDLINPPYGKEVK